MAIDYKSSTRTHQFIVWHGNDSVLHFIALLTGKNFKKDQGRGAYWYSLTTGGVSTSRFSLIWQGATHSSPLHNCLVVLVVGSADNKNTKSKTIGIQLRFFCRAPTSSSVSGKHWNPISIPITEKPEKHVENILHYFNGITSKQLQRHRRSYSLATMSGAITPIVRGAVL